MAWGLIGASTIAAEQLIKATRNVVREQLIFVNRSTQSGAEACATTHGIPQASTDLALLPSDPLERAVYVSSTNDRHLAQMLQAIAAAKRVLCDMPLALTRSDAIQMVQAAQAKGVILVTNQRQRCAGSRRAVHDLFAAGRIGRVLSLRLHHADPLPPHLQGWRIADPAGREGISEFNVHDDEVARFLLAEDPVLVVAQSGTSGMGQGVVVSVMAVWTMLSGAMVMAHESFAHTFGGTGFKGYGTDGSIVAHGVMTQCPVGEVELVTAAERKAEPDDTTGLQEHALHRFAAAVDGKGLPAATGWDRVRSLAVAVAVAEAAATVQRTDINFGVAP